MDTEPTRTILKKTKKNQFIQQILLSEKRQIQLTRFFWAKQTDTATPKDHWEKIIELEEECDFPQFSKELLISKFITSTTDKNLRGKLFKETDLDVPRVVEHIEQNTYDRKNKKNTIPEALI